MLAPSNRDHLFSQVAAVDEPQAVVLITHGIGEHLGRYSKLVNRFTSAHISVFQYDLPGHGQSAIKPTLFNKFEELTEAMDCEYQKAEEYARRYKIPLFLLGHSMGGLITAYYVCTKQPSCHGVILSAPAVDPGKRVNRLIRSGASFLSRWIPKMPYLKISAKNLSRSEGVVQAYEEDPLVYHGAIPIGVSYEMLKAMDVVQQNVKKFKINVLILQGEEDIIVPKSGTESFYTEIDIQDKTYISYPKMKHEVFNELDNEIVYQNTMTWIRRQIKLDRAY